MAHDNPALTRRGLLGSFGTVLGLQPTGVGALEFPPIESSSVNLRSEPSGFELSHPTQVIDSFIDLAATTPYLMGRSGWSEVPLDEQLWTVRRLHPDRLDTHTNIGGFFRPPTAVTGGPATVQGHFAEDVGLPVGGQHHLQPNVDGWTAWYRHRPEQERWSTDDEAVIEGALDFAAARLNGDPRINEDFGVSVPSVFFDRFREYLTEAATGFLSHGFSHVYLDNAQAPTFFGLDYSNWATEAFRRHLGDLSSDRLDSLGIENPAEFDIREYLQVEGLSPGEVGTPFVDPVAREYKRHQLRAHRDYLRRYRNGIHDAFPERSANDGISVTGNIGMDIPRPTAVVLADAFDAVHGESEQTVPDTKILDWKYKLADAAGRFQRPVVSIGSMITRGGFSTSTAEGLDPTKEYSTLQNLQVAEAFSNGARRSLSLAGWGVNDDWAVDNWIRTDGTVPDRLQSFLDFCWANRIYLESSNPSNDVALVYSLPTASWQRAPDWGSYRPTHIRAFQGAAALLRRHQLPYDVLIFGLPQVWDDTEQLNRLGSYRTVLLPAVEAVSDEQVAKIRDALAGGTHIVATGGAATLDADRQSRGDFESMLSEHANATVVQATPGLAVHDGNQPTTDLRDALTAKGRQITLDAAGVVVTVRTQSNSDRTILHFLNYDWNRETDEVPSHSDINITLNAPPTAANEARWLTPNGTHSIDVRRTSDGVEVTIPSLNLWGLLVLGEGPSAFDRGEEETAQEAIEQAESSIESATNEGREHLNLQIARAELANAEAGLSYGAYKQATNAAQRSQMLSRNAVEPPVIGIDQNHNQGQYMGWDAFENLRSRFDRYEYRELTDWSESTLSSVDMLVVPPSDTRYGFGEAELERLEKFAMAGGRVIVLGTPGVADDHTELTGQYGFGFDSDPIVQLRQSYANLGDPNVDPLEIDARGFPSTLTQYAISFRTRSVTPISINNEEVVTLGIVHQESGAFVNREGPIEERQAADVEVSGSPIIVAREVGEGYVAGIGTDEHFRNPTQGEDGGRTGPQKDALVTSLLRTSAQSDLDPAGLNGAPSAVQTQTGASSETESPPSQGTTISPGQSGFGVTTALGGISGMTALIYWLMGDEHSDD